jgi:hypothetical protein
MIRAVGTRMVWLIDELLSHLRSFRLDESFLPSSRVSGVPLNVEPVARHCQCRDGRGWDEAAYSQCWIGDLGQIHDTATSTNIPATHCVLGGRGCDKVEAKLAGSVGLSDWDPHRFSVGCWLFLPHLESRAAQHSEVARSRDDLDHSSQTPIHCHKEDPLELFEV